MEDYNPRLKAAIREVVDKQLAGKDPPETRRTLERLTREGFSDADARVLLGQAVAVEVIGDVTPFGLSGLSVTLHHLWFGRSKALLALAG